MTTAQIFDSFTTLKVLVIGDVMLDSYIWGVVDRISPEAPVPVIRVKKRDFRLGGAANVALNLKALGATPVLCALIGNDEAGKRVRESLDTQAISSEGLVISPHRPTTIKTRVIASHQHVVRIDDESDTPASAEEELLLLKHIETLLPQCQVVVFEDYDKGVLTASLIESVVGQANKLDIPTVVDPKKRNFLAYRNVTLFKPNLKELREGLKIDVDASNHVQVSEAVALLKEKLNASGVMITLSEHGIYMDHQQENVRLPAHAREIADVSGAGDTVVSIAALCVALNLTAKTTAILSNLGGGLVCQHVGVVAINKEELLYEAMKISL